MSGFERNRVEFRGGMAWWHVPERYGLVPRVDLVTADKVEERCTPATSASSCSRDAAAQLAIGRTRGTRSGSASACCASLHVLNRQYAFKEPLQRVVVEQVVAAAEHSPGEGDRVKRKGVVQDPQRLQGTPSRGNGRL
jgi:hypothetical protein